MSFEHPSSLRAHYGETTLDLSGERLKVEIQRELVATVELSLVDVDTFWSELRALTIPLVPDRMEAGVGGSGYGVEVSGGMSRFSFAWWMRSPTGWSVGADIFWKLAAYLPKDITHRYDFARGGE